MDITKALLFTKLHILRSSMIISGISLTPAMLLGSWLGYKLTSKLSGSKYSLLMNIVVLISGVLLIIEPEDFLPC